MSHLVQISAGNGPEEVARFVALLGERLLRRCAELGLPVLSRTSHGPASAPRSITLHVGGLQIERLRREEEGTHALLARSELRTGRRRKRWFAGVTFVPEAPAPRSPLRASELELTACRAGGSGGQNVNKRNTAVRVRHRPSGLSVRVDARRSQADNRRVATQRLEDLMRLAETKLEAEKTARLHIDHWRLVRGQPVRTYRLGRGDALEEIG
ncbi:MAG: peptide chain release factor-like protein [Myxococcales bacterium]